MSNALTTLTLTYKGKSSASCTQSLQVYDWTNARWVTLDTRTVGTSEARVTLTPAAPLANYVGNTSGDGEVTYRVRCSTTDSVNYFVSGDLMRATFTK